MNTSRPDRPGSAAARHAGCICERRRLRPDRVDLLCPLHGIEPVLHDALDALDALRPLTPEEQGELKMSAPPREV